MTKNIFNPIFVVMIVFIVIMLSIMTSSGEAAINCPTDTPINTPTNTEDPITPTSTEDPTYSLTPTHVYTLEPTDTPSETPVSSREDITPTPRVIIETQRPTDARENITPTSTETPYPPKASNANFIKKSYPGRYIGILTIGEDSFKLFKGIKATDGSLMLPTNVKGAALYNNVIWVHRLWKSGLININLGTNVNINGSNYFVSDISYMDYGIYPDTNWVKYIATCYEENGKWQGVVLYKLKPLIKNQGR
jgi:hypothetical protein